MPSGRSRWWPCATSAAGAVRCAGRRLVGRDDELALLLAAGERLRAGRGGLVRITGEPGIGKTRLLEARRASLIDDGGVGVRWVPAACRTTGAEIACDLSTALVRGVVGIADDDPPRTRRVAMRRVAADRAGGRRASVPDVESSHGWLPARRRPGRGGELARGGSHRLGREVVARLDPRGALPGRLGAGRLSEAYDAAMEVGHVYPDETSWFSPYAHGADADESDRLRDIGAHDAYACRWSSSSVQQDRKPSMQVTHDPPTPTSPPASTVTKTRPSRPTQRPCVAT